MKITVRSFSSWFRSSIGIVLLACAFSVFAEDVTCLVGAGPQISGVYYESPFAGVAQTSEGKDFWSDGKVPHDDATYLCAVVSQTPMTIESGHDYVFDGKSLTITQQVQNRTMYPSILTFNNEGLFLKSGKWFNNREVKNDDFCVIGGAVDIADGYVLCPGQRYYSGCGIRFTGSVTQSGTLYVQCLDTNVNRLPGILDLVGNCDGVTGTVRTEGNVVRLSNDGLPNAMIMMYAGNGFCPVVETRARTGASVAVKNITVGSYANAPEIRVAPSNTLSVGTLRCNGTSSLFKFSVSALAGSSGFGGVDVTTTLDVKTPISVDLIDWKAGCGALDIPFLRWKSGTSLTKSDFLLDAHGRDADIAIATDEDGYNVASLTAPACVWLMQSDGPIANYEQPASFADGAHWSDNGEAPHPGAEYFVTRLSDGTAVNLLTPYKNSSEISFGGDRLVIGDGCGFGIRQTPALTVPLMTLLPGSRVQFFELYNSELRGVVEIPAGAPGDSPAKMQIHFSGNAVNSASLSGAGDLMIKGAGDSSGPVGTFWLTGENGGFSGRLLVCTDDPQATFKAPPALDNHETLRFRSDASLGGARPAADAGAVTLMQYAMLWPEGSVELSEPTRGLRVDGNGQVKVDSGAAFSVCSPLTVDGTLYKIGAGTLAVKEHVGATDGRVCVKEGFLQALGTDAFVGLALSFSDGAGLALDMAEQDLDLRQYGFNGVTGISMEEGVARIPVFLTGLPDDPSVEVRTAICTVSESQANALRGKFRPYGQLAAGCRAIVEEENRENGSVTFFAKVFKPGMVILIK